MVIEVKSKLESEDDSEDETEAKEKDKEELEMRINAIEKRDSSIAELLDGFVTGLEKNISNKLQEQEKRIQNTITELQLKENSIVTSDRSFEDKTPTTQECNKQ